MKKSILLGILLFGLVFLVACSNDNSTSELKKENSSLKQQVAKLEEKKEDQNSSKEKNFGLNEEAFITNKSTGEKIYSIKIIKATTVIKTNDNLYTDGKPENTVEITYEYKNYKNQNPMIISSQFLGAFDSNGSAGKASGLMDGQTQVTEGRSSQTTTWFTMNGKMTDKNEIEIEYSNDFSLGFEGTKKFIVPLEH